MATPENGIRIYTDLEEARAIGHDAMKADRELFKDWLEANFSALLGPDARRPIVPDGPVKLSRLDAMAIDSVAAQELWTGENIARSFHDMDGGRPKIDYVVTGGKDWLDESDYSWKTFGVVNRHPNLVAHAGLRQAIKNNTRNITRDSVAQSFGGVIVDTPRTVCQLSLLNQTSGFAVKSSSRIDFSPDALLLRSWRKP